MINLAKKSFFIILFLFILSLNTAHACFMTGNFDERSYIIYNQSKEICKLTISVEDELGSSLEETKFEPKPNDVANKYGFNCKENGLVFVKENWNSISQIVNNLKSSEYDEYVIRLESDSDYEKFQKRAEKTNESKCDCKGIYEVQRVDQFTGYKESMNCSTDGSCLPILPGECSIIDEVRYGGFFYRYFFQIAIFCYCSIIIAVVAFVIWIGQIRQKHYNKK